MANAQELIDAISRIVQDGRYDDDTILRFLNQGIYEIAGWNNDIPELGPVGKVLLPALETRSVTVAPGQGEPDRRVITIPGQEYVALPSDYMRELYAVSYPAQTRVVNILKGNRSLIEAWDASLNYEGPISDVTILGSNLYFRPLPAEATTLVLFYYRKPTVLTLMDSVGDSEIPGCLPEHLHIPLLVNYGAREIFNEKEDGIEDPKTNTKVYDGRFLSAMFRLYKGIEHKSPQITKIRRTSRFF